MSRRFVYIIKDEKCIFINIKHILSVEFTNFSTCEITTIDHKTFYIQGEKECSRLEKIFYDEAN